MQTFKKCCFYYFNLYHIITYGDIQLLCVSLGKVIPIFPFQVETGSIAFLHHVKMNGDFPCIRRSGLRSWYPEGCSCLFKNQRKMNMRLGGKLK